MLGWLRWRSPPAGDRLAANFKRVRLLFGERFPAGWFCSCDFRPHFDGHGHSAWVPVEPQASVAATRALAYARLAEMVEFLRPLQSLCGPHDRVQFSAGLPEALAPPTPNIYKGWVPAARLAEVQPPDFAAVSGGFGENDNWFEGLWEASVRDAGVAPAATPS